MKETDLYIPVRDLLEKQGFIVKGEVVAVDVFAMKGELTIAVELKTKISLKLIYQAVERQKIADFVYIAVTRQALTSHKSSYRSLISLLKRLSIGLIVIENKASKVIIEAKGAEQITSKKRNKKRQLKIVKEFSERESDFNLGGTKGQIVTAYREKVVKIACLMQDGKMYTPMSLKKETEIKETARILQNNYYKWFIRVKMGHYILSEVGKIELKDHLDNLKIGKA